MTTSRRDFLRALGLGAALIAVPQFGRWHRLGSGLLVPRGTGILLPTGIKPGDLLVLTTMGMEVAPPGKDWCLVHSTHSPVDPRLDTNTYFKTVEKRLTGSRAGSAVRPQLVGQVYGGGMGQATYAVVALRGVAPIARSGGTGLGEDIALRLPVAQGWRQTP